METTESEAPRNNSDAARAAFLEWIRRRQRAASSGGEDRVESAQDLSSCRVGWYHVSEPDSETRLRLVAFLDSHSRSTTRQKARLADPGRVGQRSATHQVVNLCGGLRFADPPYEFGRFLAIRRVVVRDR